MTKPLMVIYTSGTTGLPKGINNNHMKLLAIGMAVSANLGARARRRRLRLHAALPLERDLPRLPSGLPRGRQPRHPRALQREPVRARRASATASRTGTTSASRCTTCSARSRSSTAATRPASRPRSTNNPKNQLRYALGNGAAPPDIERFMQLARPRGHVRALRLDRGRDQHVPQEGRPARLRRRDHRLRREDPERARRGVPARRARPRRQDHATTPRRSARSAASPPTPASSRATSTTPTPTPRSTATASTTRATSATSLERDGTRFLFFDGRTDDWIRKDGENFSALQVARLVQEHPDVVLAAAYGVPCAVSDELVMAALKLRDGRALRPARRFFDFCERQVTARRHGPQVVPRLRPPGRRVRVHADREDPGAEPEEACTSTAAACPTSRSTGASRGDTTYRPLTRRGLREAARPSSRGARSSTCWIAERPARVR